MKKNQKTAIPVTPDVPADPFATTHSADISSVCVSDLDIDSVLVIDGKSYEIERNVAVGAGNQYVEWKEGDRTIGSLRPRTAKVIVRRLLPPPPPPREEQSFREALSSGYYTTKLPYGERNSAERAAHTVDQQRLNEEFRRDLESDECNDKLPESVRNDIFNLAYTEGHSGGKSEVASVYSTYHDLALRAYEAGQQNPNRS